MTLQDFKAKYTTGIKKKLPNPVKVSTKVTALNFTEVELCNGTMGDLLSDYVNHILLKDGSDEWYIVNDLFLSVFNNLTPYPVEWWVRSKL